MKKMIAVLLAVLLPGCGTIGTLQRPQSYYEDTAIQATDNNTSFSMLVAENQNSLDEAAIQNLLSRKVTFPDKGRIAVLKTSLDYFHSRYLSEDIAFLNKDITEGFFGILRDSSRIYDASFLPSLLTKPRQTFSDLRLAATRYQADALLIFDQKCHQFEKHRIFTDNLYKAYCTVEAALVDTRSGLITFSALSTQEFSAEREKVDVNFEEAKAKARMGAIGHCLADIGKQLRYFIESMPAGKV